MNKICLELHPGFMAYNPKTMLRLRAGAGRNLYANVDPSHLFWQGMDPARAIEELGEAVGFFHAKDTFIYDERRAVNGVLDYTAFASGEKRSWLFRTVGYGHGASAWKRIVSALREVGYDDVVSIEHEDGLMSQREGLEKAVRFMQDVLIKEPAGSIWWG